MPIRIVGGPVSFRWLTVLALVLAHGPGLAANYEVGPARADKTFQTVLAKLNPGDTVFVDGGATYPAVAFSRAGTKAAPIVILGRRADGKRPVISGGANTVHFKSDDPYKTGADHMVFQGFEVTGGTSRCIYHQADDITIRDVAVHDCSSHGILGGDLGSGSLLLEYTEVWNCGLGDHLHQIYMSTDEVNHPGSVFRMQHCYVHDAKGGNNVKSRSERNEIYYNWIEGAYYHELELIGSDPGGVDDGWTPRLKREDADVVGNVFWKRRTAAANDSNFSVFRIGGDGTGESHGRYRFTDNTIIAGTGAVFRCFDSLESVEMHNNVFHRPGGGLNLMRVAEAAWTQGHAVIAGNGNWITTGAANVPAEWKGTLQGTDPGFADFSGKDLRPLAGSPLANAAATSTPGPAGFDFPNPLFPPAYCPPFHAAAQTPVIRPSQGALDIGAYEVGTAAAIRPDRSARSDGPVTRAALLRSGGRVLARRAAEDGSESLHSLVGRRADPEP
ncbi:MAG: putative peptidoglycan bound protein [Fibrobacteres bacterium]|nr:putative peptidoglycan bound protein [Fibrobacterota bacterium]